MDDILNNISVSLKAILWRKHARIEAEKDGINESDLEDALRKGFTSVEHYPDDSYGESALVLVFIAERPVHVVLSPREDFCYLITTYVPDSERWDERFIKRKGRGK